MDGIANSVASTLGVDRNAVSVTVTSASVLVSVSIAVPDATAEAALTTQVSTNLGSNAAATTMLTSQMPAGAPSLTVTEVRTDPGEESTDNTPLIAGAVAGGLGGVCCLGCVLSFMFCHASFVAFIGMFAGMKKNEKAVSSSSSSV